MPTETPPQDAELKERKLAEHILKGDSLQASESAKHLLLHMKDANDVVDAISDTMNIVSDLHEVERYSLERVESCERAAESALEAIRREIRVEQRRISGRVMVTSLKGDPHSFDKTLLLAMLTIGGFTPLDGGGDLTPEEAASKASELKPDLLAIPLVTSTAAKNLIEAASLIVSSGSGLLVVAYGRGIRELGQQPGLKALEEDTLAALSRIAELLLERQRLSLLP